VTAYAYNYFLDKAGIKDRQTCLFME
jgi:hypothetical protein